MPQDLNGDRQKIDINKLLHETVLINFSCFMTTLDHKELVQCVCDLMDIEYKDKGPVSI